MSFCQKEAFRLASKPWIQLLRLQRVWLDCEDRYQFTWTRRTLCLEWLACACSAGE